MHKLEYLINSLPHLVGSCLTIVRSVYSFERTHCFDVDEGSFVWQFKKQTRSTRIRSELDGGHHQTVVPFSSDNCLGGVFVPGDAATRRVSGSACVSMEIVLGKK